jgi:nitrogen regulatory protein P-II 1
MSKDKITYLTDVSLLTCIVQTGYVENILKAARDVGASAGAVSHHARGIGVRERLGLLGVAVEAEKDVINILISTEQTDLVFDTVFKAAGLDTPGRGFIFVTPLEKASTYIPESIMQRVKQSD